MKMINLTINDKKITTSAGKTILEVVREHKLDDIPTLCHDDRLEPYASCFMCVVEVKGVARLLPACSTQVNEGMEIQTNSEKITSARKTALELLLSNHYADCIGPCIFHCPASVDAQGYISLIRMGKYADALKLIKMNNPLPLSIGRVCVRNCEDACRRNCVDNSVAINYMKRYVADFDYNKWRPEQKTKNGKKAAIVGGGPAGLTCAYYLAIEGYDITIFEKLDELGGMLRYGIPEYRLPKEILDDEINWILSLGINVKTNAEMGKDFTIASLKESGYESVYLSVGAHKASAMGLDGENQIEGVYKGIDYLREVTEKGAEKLQGTAVIVGGGNTAIDAARTALRCGADNVHIVYRRSISEMPAHISEIEAAQEEGVNIQFLTLPKSIISEDGKLKAIICSKMELIDAGPGQRPKPVPIDDSDFRIDCEYLISAIGQQVDLSFIESEKDCKLERWGTISVDKETYETSIEGVFAGGDVVNGPLTAVSAIGQSKKAAQSISRYLEGKPVSTGDKKFYSLKTRFGEVSESEFTKILKAEKTKMPELPLDFRQGNFKEVDLGLTESQLMNEAGRCLECGCSEYNDCSLRKYADEYKIEIEDYLGEVKKFKVDSRHPFIKLDPNKCINCGLCVRTCSEILDVSALGFVYRGFRSIVKPAMEKPLLETNCINCGNCIDVCPTGAISENFKFNALGTHAREDKSTICNFCSLGCNVNFKVIDNDIFWVANTTDEIKKTKNEGYLCFKGKFAHRYLNSKNVILSPAIRKNGDLQQVDWKTALDYTVDKIRDIIGDYGTEAVAIFASPKMSNEDLYLVQKFARAGVRTNNICSLSEVLYDVELDALDDYLGATASNITFDDIEKSDVIVLINSDLTEDNLILELKIKKARKNGAKVVVISSYETDFVSSADLWLDGTKGSNTLIIDAMINEMIKRNGTASAELSEIVKAFDTDAVYDFAGIDREKFKSFVDIMNVADANISFVYNIDSLKDKSKNDLKAICNYLIMTDRMDKPGNGIFIIREFSNSTGMADMGVNSKYLPGYVKMDEDEEIARIEEFWDIKLKDIFHPVDIRTKLLDGTIKAALIFGEDPLADVINNKYFNDVEFIMLLDAFESETAKIADVVLPGLSRIEQSGTMTSCDTNVQKFNPVIDKRNNLENWEIISNLAKYFNYGFIYESSEEVFAEIQKVNRIYSNINIGDYWNSVQENKDLLAGMKRVKYLNHKVELTAFGQQKPSLHYSEYFYKNFILTKINNYQRVYEHE